MLVSSREVQYVYKKTAREYYTPGAKKQAGRRSVGFCSAGHLMPAKTTTMTTTMGTETETTTTHLERPVVEDLGGVLPLVRARPIGCCRDA